jgi:uncharacterized membrane protein
MRNNQWTTPASWLLFAAVMYLILTEAVGHWVELPGLGNIGFTLVFVLFAIFHCAALSGWKTTGRFFVLAALISFLLEVIGVRTGWVYGAYHYSPMLGPKLAGVPVLIPLAWFMMIYPSWLVARALMSGVNVGSLAGLVSQALIAAMVMTAWDTVMDPGMAAAGNWVWEHGGSYFGVPLRNYLGWLLTTFLVYLGAGLLWRGKSPSAAIGKGFPALPIIVYAFYGISYVTPRRIPALQVVALFAMVLPALLALMRVWLPRGFADRTRARDTA